MNLSCSQDVLFTFFLNGLVHYLGSCVDILSFNLSHLDEISFNSFTINFVQTNLDKSSSCSFLWAALYFNFQVRTIQLGKYLISWNGKHKCSVLITDFKPIFIQKTNAIDAQTLTQGGVESDLLWVSVINALGNTSNDLATDWALLGEIEIWFVWKLIEADPYSGVMTDLDKATSLTDVGYVALEKAISTDGQFGTEFENFVAQITLLLIFGV